MEWNYGELEGHTLAEWHASHPGWDIWKDGCPGGETIDEVGTRADRVIAHLSVNPVTTVLFAHGHLLRALTARWLHLPAACARNLVLGTTAISVLTWEHDLRVLDRWNLSEAEASVPAGPHPPATER